MLTDALATVRRAADADICEASVPGRWQVNRLLLRGWPSVDVELVALEVFHRDRVVVKAVGVQDADYGGPQTGSTASVSTRS